MASEHAEVDYQHIRETLLTSAVALAISLAVFFVFPFPAAKPAASQTKHSPE